MATSSLGISAFFAPEMFFYRKICVLELDSSLKDKSLVFDVKLIHPITTLIPQLGSSSIILSSCVLLHYDDDES